MTKSRERSEASYSTSRAEQMAIEWLKTEYQAQDVHEDYLDERQGDEAFAFLAGMKAMYLELEKYAQEIKDAEFPATREQQIIVDKITRDLGKLMEQE